MGTVLRMLSDQYDIFYSLKFKNSCKIKSQKSSQRCFDELILG